MSIQTNIAEIRSRIAAACAESGREAGEITLVGASKMNDAAACREAIAAGIDVLGEMARPCTLSATSSVTRSNRWWAR